MKNVVLLSLVLMLLAAIASAQDAPRVVHGGVVNGKAISLPKPIYPEALKGTGTEGAVAVNILIDQNGTIISAEADPYDRRARKNADGTDADPVMVDPMLREAAENAARQARFAPTFLGGKGVQVKGQIIYNFVSGDAVAEASKPAPSFAGVSVPDGDGPAKPKMLTGGVLNGKALSLPQPSYPAAAKAVRAEGTVGVQIMLDEGGNVVSATAVSGHPLLRNSAVAAAYQAKFSPTLLQGVPVKVTGILSYNFVLPRKEDQ